MKKFKLLLVCSLFVNSLLASEVVIKFSHVVPVNSPKGQMAERFKKLAEERSNKNIKVDIFPNSQLFTDGKVMKAILLGDVQLAAPSLSKFSRFTKKLQVFDLPFLFKDMSSVDRFQKSEIGEQLLKSMEKKGIVGLGYLHNGLKQMSANFPILEPKDAKGKKFRIQSSDVIASQFEELGGIPLKKPFSEVFTLLQTKAVDGTENPWSSTYAKKFFEVQSDISETDHGLVDYMVVSSKKFMDKLSKEHRQIVESSLKEAIAYGNKLAAEKTKLDRQTIIDSGITTVHPISEEQRKLWIKTVQPVWAEFEKEIGKDVIKAALDSNK